MDAAGGRGRSVAVDAAARRPPVLIGGTGPKTLRLAGEIADGVVVDSRYSTRTVLEALAHVAAGRADVFGVGGTVAQIVAGLAAYRDAGVDTIALQPLGPLQRMGEFIAAAGEVTGRVRRGGSPGD